jgi:uncharacterized Ntn-hydrolase superfamily protein
VTFTVLGRCARSGKLGFAQATSTPAVGWRCTDVVPGRGVLTVQAHGDYRQLQAAKGLLAAGRTPSQVLQELSASDPFYGFRQIAVLGLDGSVVVHTGPRARPWAGEIADADFVATGNVLVGQGVVQAMADAFRRHATEELEERLMRTLEAGRDAGGQEEGQTSSALVVYERHAFPIVNLRVDVAAEPVGELRRIFDWFRPLIPYYVERTLDPGSVVPKKAWLEARGLVVNPFRQ